MKPTVFGYCVKTTCLVSLILVQIIFFVHSEEKEAETHSVSKMELVDERAVELESVFLSTMVAVS